MAITVDIQSNPTIINTGSALSRCTIIYSGYSTGTIVYEIRLLEAQNSKGNIVVGEGLDPNVYPQVVESLKDHLSIQLKGRTWYKVRVSQNGVWTDWTTFKTRDTRYQTPDAIYQQRLDPITGTKKTSAGATVITTNYGKPTIKKTSTGATVTVTGDDGNQVTSISKTSYGMKIVTKDRSSYKGGHKL